MRSITVCVGSACHLKGAYDVIQSLKALIDRHSLSGTVELKASFCLGCCSEGVSVRVDEADVTSVTRENVERFFHANFLGGEGGETPWA